jgi:hypothetical protein
MSRNLEIEGILEAWFRLDDCLPAVQTYLYSQYRDYRRDKRRLEQVSVAQSAMKK